MHLKNRFDAKKVEEFLIKENKFIADLFSVTTIPERRALDFDEIEDENENEQNSKLNTHKKTSRAKSLHELQERLHTITSKKKLSYKEKLTKKNLKNRMKKKTKQDERNAKQKMSKAAKLRFKTEKTFENDDTSLKPKEIKVFNSENKIMFSKVDFADMTKKKNNQEKDPKKILKKLHNQKGFLQQLEESGDHQKATEIKEKTAWKNALAKVEGQKVKDDPVLLKKSVQRNEQKKRSSKKKWENRIKGVQNAKEERQRKRTDNIEKRKKDKKIKKLKKASKKGKIIPGF